MSKLESGHARPALVTVRRLAILFGVEEAELMLSAGYMPEEFQELVRERPGEVAALLREELEDYGAAEGSPTQSEDVSRGFGRLYAVYNEDCFEWLKRCRDNRFQAVVTDPPYGLKEYSREEKDKLRRRSGGVWRIPPSLGGYERSPLPRFTILTRQDRNRLREYFVEWARLVHRVLVPGGHVFIATNPLVSHQLYCALEEAGFEKRGEIIRLVQTLRGGDRPKNAHDEFAGVTVMPRSAWEPWGLFRKLCEGRVQDTLRKWKAGGLRRISDKQPFFDVIRSSPTRAVERAIAPHPSLKPQSFMRQIVRAALPLGEGVILDPFMGAGSTVAAAVSLGYHSIGVEVDGAYFQAAKGAIPKLAVLRPDRSQDSHRPAKSASRAQRPLFAGA